MFDISKINCPKLAVDAIIQMGDRIVLIKRKFEPIGYAFPGGFVDYGESLEDAVRREVKEETTLDFEVMGILYPRSDPNRDPRGHIITMPFYGIGTGNPQAKDDAKEIVLARKETLLKEYNLVFDHKQIYINFIFQHES